MMHLKEILEKSTEFLQKQGIPHARRQAELIIADALGMKRIDLYMHFDQPLEEEELNRCRISIKRRSQGEPSQHIRGTVDFMDCRIHVNSEVLIPRQETEILVSKVIDSLKTESNLSGKSLWDLCCGSGCIGIALKKAFPNLTVTSSDVSAGALAAAEKNAAENQVEISFRKGDLLVPFNGEKANYVVCNPPYISLPEYDALEREVKEYEPKIALLAGQEGLDFYHRLADTLPQYLVPGGKVWFEIGYKQGQAIKSLFSSPPWKTNRLEKDWSGNDRFFFLEIE